eukprot:TRINITY_DN6059_c0_g2_i1.p1 TRINITY_DN6059_c0_g2~~TRINITY_DN6059_c0_g2_i1.p1  ORF type:complete len:476 (+),score=42.88 TRINITY_DN6059_c0_g2_i1:1-1428(+)
MGNAQTPKSKRRGSLVNNKNEEKHSEPENNEPLLLAEKVELSQPCYIENVPKEILIHVFSNYIDENMLCKVPLVCKYFLNCSNDQSMWEMKSKNSNLFFDHQRTHPNNWKEYYRLARNRCDTIVKKSFKKSFGIDEYFVNHSCGLKLRIKARKDLTRRNVTMFHPNVANVYGTKIISGESYLIREVIEGFSIVELFPFPSLMKLIADEGSLLTIIHDILRVCRDCQELNTSDINESNIYISNGRPIIDWEPEVIRRIYRQRTGIYPQRTSTTSNIHRMTTGIMPVYHFRDLIPFTSHIGNVIVKIILSSSSDKNNIKEQQQQHSFEEVKGHLNSYSEMFQNLVKSLLDHSVPLEEILLQDVFNNFKPCYEYLKNVQNTPEFLQSKIVIESSACNQLSPYSAPGTPYDDWKFVNFEKFMSLPSVIPNINEVEGFEYKDDFISDEEAENLKQNIYSDTIICLLMLLHYLYHLISIFY